MVYLNKVMQDYEKEIRLKENSNKWLLSFLFKEKLPKLNVYDETLIALRGYSGEGVEESVLDLFINKKGKINYTSSVSLFIGIHLADKNNKYKNKVFEYYSKLKTLKQKYTMQLCFTFLEPVFYQEIVSLQDKEGLDIFKYLIDVETVEPNKEVINDLKNLDVYDLIIYKKIINKDANQLIKGKLIDNIILMLNNFSNAIVKITSNRYNKQPGIVIKQEYDVQDILFSFFKFYFNDLIRENPFPKKAGTYSIIDLCFPEKKLYIEIKMLKETDKDEKKTIEQLKKDMFDYNDKSVKDLIIFVYDPFHKINDKDIFNDFEKIDSFNCKVIIAN